MEPTAVPEPTVDHDDKRARLLLIMSVSVLCYAIAWAVISRRRQPAAPTVPMPEYERESWQNTIDHLVKGWEYRYAGIDNRLNALESPPHIAAADGVQAPPPPPRPAVTSLDVPSTVTPDNNGEAPPIIERVPPVLEVG